MRKGLWISSVVLCAAMASGVWASAGDLAGELASVLPADVKLVRASSIDGQVTVEFSDTVLAELSESRLRGLFEQVRAAVEGPQVRSIKLTCKGRPLSSFLPKPPAVRSVNEPTVAAKQEPATTTSTALAGRSITIAPSHGRFYNGTAWAWQRSEPCGFGESVLEDTNSIRLAQYLQTYLQQDGATVHVPRQMGEGSCCHSETGLHWWKMAARYWLEEIEVPETIWNSAGPHLDDDIRCRPLYADHVTSDIFISQHTNGGGGTGTETFFDSVMDYPAQEADSQLLATAVHDAVMAAVQGGYDPAWADRGAKDAAGAYGEIRIPNQPACLIETAFHDNCAKDALYLQDNVFRSLTQWGIYKGICDYFGVTPTWDKYSCELDGSGGSIPATMVAGQEYPVTLFFRNRGVAWRSDAGFYLGAVDSNDPFAPATRIELPGEYGPGETAAIDIVLRAPDMPGTYQTQWQMVRDPDQWFGPIFSQSITVEPIDPTVGWAESWATLGPFEGNVLTDQLAGPCNYTERNMDPSVGNLTKGLAWTHASAVSVFGGMGIDLSGLSATDDKNAYAHTYLLNPTTRQIRARVGAAQGFALFVDGQEIDRQTGGTGAVDEFVSYPFILANGWHRVMIHVARNSGPWGFALRFDDGNSNILDDLSFTAYRSGIGLTEGLMVPDDPAARPPCMRDWLVLGNATQGPIAGQICCAKCNYDYLSANGGGTQPNCRPYAGQNASIRTWTNMRDSSLIQFAAGAAMLDYNTYYGGPDTKVAYAHTYCYNPGPAVQARVTLGSDDMGFMWVNGVQRIAACAARGGSCDQNISSVFTLNHGDNSILFRVDDQHVLWYGVARLIEASTTNPLAGVIFKPNPSVPQFIQQPLPRDIMYLASTTLSVQAGGFGVSYRWQKDGVNLADGPVAKSDKAAASYSGTGTATLTIANASAAVIGRYRCAITNVSGTTYSDEVPVTVGLIMTGLRSVRTHDAGGSGGVGPVDHALTLPTDGTGGVEPRRGGVEKLVVTFSEPAKLTAGVSPQDVEVLDSLGNAYPPSTIAIAPDGTLELLFAPSGLPDAQSYTLRLLGDFKGGTSDLALIGDKDCQVIALVGDVNQDGAVNLIDLAASKQYNRAALNAANARFDVNLDGRLDLVDMALIKRKVGNSIP